MDRYYEVDREVLKKSTVGSVIAEAKGKLSAFLASHSSHLPESKSTHPSRVVGVKLRHGTELLDFWMTQHIRPMPPLRENDALEIIYSSISCSILLRNRRQ